MQDVGCKVGAQRDSEAKKNMKTVAIVGNTYPVKEKLKSIGAKWNADAKSWMIDEAKLSEAQKIVSETPKDFKATPFIYHRCKECGCAPSRYNKIYGNGVCKDCYRSNKEEAEMGY